MPSAPPRHRPPGWQPYAKRPDPSHDYYRTAAWRALREHVLRRDGHRCTLRYERCTITATRVDHIVERKHGGADAMSNLRSVCAACDNRRHANKGGHNRR